MIDLGDVVPLTINITNSSGVAADAGAVTITIVLPDGTTGVNAVSVSPTVTGTYQYDYTTAQAGRHTVRWVATGVNAGAYSDAFIVSDTADLGVVSLADVKAHLNTPAVVGTTYDEELRDIIAAATVACADYTGRTLTRTTFTEWYSGGGMMLPLRHSPVISVTTVSENGTALTASDYVLDEANGVLWRGTTSTQMAWTSGVRNVNVTYVAGYADPPVAIRMAVLRMVEHLWQRSQQAPHPALGMQSSSTGLPDESLPRNTYLLPYQVQSWLTPYRVAGF